MDFREVSFSGKAISGLRNIHSLLNCLVFLANPPPSFWKHPHPMVIMAPSVKCTDVCYGSVCNVNKFPLDSLSLPQNRSLCATTGEDGRSRATAPPARRPPPFLPPSTMAPSTLFFRRPIIPRDAWTTSSSGIPTQTDARSHPYWKWRRSSPLVISPSKS